MKELDDEGQIAEIKDFVRNNPDIEVTEYIKRGNNGEVYFGKRKKLGDEVVLKFYWSNPGFDATEEAVILKNIKHKNILEIYDLRFLPPNYAYFLTPKISGGDLQGIIDNRKLSTKESLEIIAGILIGLTELHSIHKLVHRDLKPGNILIDLSDNTPIIADLGAVKKIESNLNCVTASKSTYLYLPPEAASKNEYYFQSDIYQIGIIFFQLLGGYFPIDEPYCWLTENEINQLAKIRDPWDKDKKFKGFIAKRILKGKLIDINTLPYYIDSAFKKVIQTALHVNYLKRYLYPSMFLKDIHQLLRTCPEYIHQGDLLLLRHENGKQYQIYHNNKNEIVLEKSNSNNQWRKVNSHNGTMESVLSIARLS